MGQVSGNVNRNLKWAFVETGNLIVINQRGLAGLTSCGCINLSNPAIIIRRRWSRQLAEAAWRVLTKQDVYREPHGSRQQALSSTHG